MKTYTIKANNHYAWGSRIQLCIFQILLTLLPIFLGIFYHNLLWAIPSPIVFFIFYYILERYSKNFSFKVRFDESCIYTLKENYDQINKLYGISTGYHHHNSARIGWRCIDGKTIELLGYCYTESNRVSKTIMNVNVGEWIVCNIQEKTDKYVFKAMNTKVVGNICIINKAPFKLKYEILKLFIYKLYPYFGGSIAAPQNMKIDIVDLKKFSYDE